MVMEEGMAEAEETLTSKINTTVTQRFHRVLLYDVASQMRWCSNFIPHWGRFRSGVFSPGDLL